MFTERFRSNSASTSTTSFFLRCVVFFGTGSRSVRSCNAPHPTILGIDIEDDRVALHDDAELAEIRKAITRSPAGADARAFIDRSKAQQAKRSEP